MRGEGSVQVLVDHVGHYVRVWPTHQLLDNMLEYTRTDMANKEGLEMRQAIQVHTDYQFPIMVGLTVNSDRYKCPSIHTVVTSPVSREKPPVSIGKD